MKPITRSTTLSNRRFRVYIKRLSLISRVWRIGRYPKRVFSKYVDSSTGDRRRNNVGNLVGRNGVGGWKRERERSESGARQRESSERYNFIDGSGNNLVDNAAVPPSGTSQLVSSIRSRLDSNPTVAAFNRFRCFRSVESQLAPGGGGGWRAGKISMISTR